MSDRDLTDDDPRLDALLGALPFPPGDEDAPLDDLDDLALARYRAGQLTEPEAEAVEARLLADPHARAVWQAQAEAVDPALLARLAERTLPGQRWAPRLAMLAAAALVIGLASLLWMTRGPVAPAFQTDYQLVAIKGGVQLARGDAPPQISGPIALAPGATLKVLLKPGAATVVPDVAVYVDRAGALARVAEVVVESGEGGGLRVSAPADALLAQGAAMVLVVLRDPAAPVDLIRTEQLAELACERCVVRVQVVPAEAAP